MRWTNCSPDPGVDGADWKGFRSADLDTISSTHKSPVIFDGRKMYDPDMVRGIEAVPGGQPTGLTMSPPGCAGADMPPVEIGS